MGNSKQFEIRIDDPTTYVEATSQTQELQIEYVQAYPGDVTKHQYYDAFLCKIPGIKDPKLLYKLFVKENHPDSEKKTVFEKSFSQLPAFTLTRSTLLLFNRKKNQIKIRTFKTVYRQPFCYTEDTMLRRIKLPSELKVKQDPTYIEVNRRELAKNIPDKFRRQKTEVDKDMELFIQTQARQMTRIDKRQIQYTKNGSIYLNTEDGVKFITEGQLPKGSTEAKEITMAELGADKSVPKGYTVSMLFSQAENLWIMAESESEQKLSIARSQADLKVVKETREFFVDRPHRIIKSFAHDNKIFTLDVEGNVNIIDLDQCRVEYSEETCTDIYVTKTAYFTQRIMKNDRNKLYYQV